MIPSSIRGRCAPLVLCLLCLGTFSATAAEFGVVRTADRLSPSGLAGAAMVVGRRQPDSAACERFRQLAGGPRASLVALAFDQQDADDLTTAFGDWEVQVFLLTTRDSADAAALIEALQTATGVWLASGKNPQELMEVVRGTKVVEQLVELRKRRGTIAASGTAVALISSMQVVEPPTNGLDLLPGIVCQTEAGELAHQQLIRLLDQHRHLAGIQLNEDLAFMVQGRQIRAFGKSPIAFQLAGTDTRPVRTISLEPGQRADYVELRRAAAGRAQPALPAEPGLPEVKSGALVIVGGGGLPDDIARRFVELGGGGEGRFVVLPTAMPDPLPASSGEGFLKKHGAKNIVVLKSREQQELDLPENLEVLRKATAIWFGGGRQWHFVDAYEGTKAGELFHDVLRRGGVIGGSSAGATIQGEYLVRGAPAGPHIMMCEGYERGLGFLPGVAIDQHFTQRKRFGDMTALMAAYPQFLGIGIDEATALVVRGHVAEVMGKGSVHFYDRRKPLAEGQPDYESVPAPGQYDLRERRIVQQGDVNGQ